MNLLLKPNGTRKKTSASSSPSDTTSIRTIITTETTATVMESIRAGIIRSSSNTRSGRRHRQRRHPQFKVVEPPIAQVMPSHRLLLTIGTRVRSTLVTRSLCLHYLPTVDLLVRKSLTADLDWERIGEPSDMIGETNIEETTHLVILQLNSNLKPISS